MDDYGDDGGGGRGGSIYIYIFFWGGGTAIALFVIHCLNLFANFRT
jgi:hypothetical protein